ncbi:hypothetical protein [Mycolicibacterium mengxianglii]|uniref:hypothetical protein n=1 Tax=Mycolicibacterium mengxianglii TaxID=2736649 RepID=UPI0018D15B23|nr:hypothetical protein [Mycolicibacterium mengxianglii]
MNVTRVDGGTDEYARYGDAYVKHSDGTLDVVRTGSRVPHSYHQGEWIDVDGDERRPKVRRF